MSMIKFGYVTVDDLVEINGESFKVLDTNNLYALARKFMWKHPDRSWDEYTDYLIEIGLIEPAEGQPIVASYHISHTSPNIFALEALFANYPKVVESITSQALGYTGTWMNTARYYEKMKDLFVKFEAGEITKTEFYDEFNEFIEEVKDLK